MLSNPNHKSSDEENKFVENIIDGSVIDVDFCEIIPEDLENNEYV